MEQHAGIAVALAEGFSRADVLGQERIDEAAYRPADVAWKQRLVADAAAEGSLFAAYRAKRAEAEDWLHRKVTPLDGDLGAWLGFLKAWSAAPRPFDILERAGLRLADVARLGRSWERALAADPKLRKRAEELAAAAEMPSRVTVDPSKLRPFPWSPGAAAEAPLEAESHDEAPVTPPDLAEVVVVQAVPSYMREDGLWSPIEPSTRAPGSVPVQGSAPGRVLPSYARDVAPDATAPVFYLRGGDALPFSGEGASPPAVSTPDENRILPAPSGETALVFELPRTVATPFERSSAPAPTPPQETPSPVALQSHPGHFQQGVPPLAARGAAVPPKPLAPLASGGTPESPGTPRGQGAKSEPAFGTVAVFELPRGLVLPFAPRAPGSGRIGETLPLVTPSENPSLPFGDAPATPGAKAESAAARPPAQSGETVLLGPAISPPPTPFARPPAAPQQALCPPAHPPSPAAARPDAARSAPPAAPRGGPPVGHPAGQSPPLSLEDHAVLCAEIALRPGRAGDTLARCGLDPASKAALDAHFNALRSAQPAADAAWNKTYRESYTKLILSAWKGPGAK